VWVKATDNVGNYVEKNVSFITDITTPYVVIVNPVDGAMFNASSVLMEWSAVDNATSIAYMHVWSDDGVPVNMTSGDDYLFEDLTEGAHTLHVKAWDLVGNSQEKTVSITVDLTNPDVVITYPQWEQRLNDVVINATWIVHDDVTPIVMIEVAIDAGFYEDVGLNTSKLFSGVAEGNHTIYVRAWDSAGNSEMQHVFFTVDRTAPTMADHLPASAAIVVPSVVVKITFSEAMNQTSVVITGITATKTWNTAGTEVTLTHAALAYATSYTIVVTGKDIAGNELTGTASWTFKVVTQVTGTVNNDKGNPIVNATVKITQGTAVVEGTTDALGHFALIVDGVGLYNLTISATGFQEFVRNDVSFGVEQNNTLGALAMTPNPDYTLLIVGVVVVLAVVLAALFLMRRRKK
jgi:hypothetical protein